MDGSCDMTTNSAPAVRAGGQCKLMNEVFTVCFDQYCNHAQNEGVRKAAAAGVYLNSDLCKLL